MYVSLRDGFTRSRGGAAVSARVTGTVVLLGIVSLLTDVSSEAVSAVLPLYLTTVVGLSPLAYGVVDALYQGVSALVRISGGWAADRSDHPKWIAVAGYGVSAASRLALLLVSGLAAITAVITVDRLGKGVRTAPRDSLITAASEPAILGRAFGVHRALDTAGALTGPIIAFIILWMLPGAYSSVFVVSFVFAMLGVAVLLLLVPDLQPRQKQSHRAVVAAVPTKWSWKPLADRRLLRLVIGAGILGVFTIGDGFLYLSLQDRGNIAAMYFPLLFVGTNIGYMALAVPMGRLADRYGRAKVFLIGHIALLGAYVATALPLSSSWGTLLALLLLGAFYAGTDGILAAIAGQLVEPAARATGIASAQTVVALARAVASLGFGLLWVRTGRSEALWFVAAALAVALAIVFRPVSRLDRVDGSTVTEASRA